MAAGGGKGHPKTPRARAFELEGDAYPTILIPEPTPSQNVLRRMNKWKYAKMRDRFCWWLRIEKQKHRIPDVVPYTKRKMIIYRYARNPRYLLDRGNFIGGCKPLLDAATRMQLIHDDSERFLEDEYHQEIAKSAHVAITFSEIG